MLLFGGTIGRIFSIISFDHLHFFIFQATNLLNKAEFEIMRKKTEHSTFMVVDVL